MKNPKLVMLNVLKTKKRRLVLLGALIVSTIVGSTFAAVTLSRASPPISKASDPLYTYTAKFICNLPFFDSSLNSLHPNNAEAIGLVPGEYKTDINVHNPNQTATLNIKKEFILAVPESPNITSTPNKTISTTLGPDAAFFTDCNEILLNLGLCFLNPTGSLICPKPAKGWVVLTTSTPNLDVWAEYTALSVNAINPPFQMTGISLDVKKISPVLLPTPVCTPDFTLSVSPSSITIPPGGNGSVTKTVTGNACFQGTVCFTATSLPGITVIFSPACVTLPPSPQTVVEFISVSSSVLPGSYPITNTGCSNTGICHSAMVIVNVP